MKIIELLSPPLFSGRHKGSPRQRSPRQRSPTLSITAPSLIADTNIPENNEWRLERVSKARPHRLPRPRIRSAQHRVATVRGCAAQFDERPPAVPLEVLSEFPAFPPIYFVSSLQHLPPPPVLTTKFKLQNQSEKDDDPEEATDEEYAADASNQLLGAQCTLRSREHSAEGTEQTQSGTEARDKSPVASANNEWCGRVLRSVHTRLVLRELRRVAKLDRALTRVTRQRLYNTRSHSPALKTDKNYPRCQ